MEVIVQDANNIVIEVDQGRQGRGVEDVSLITVGADYYLLFTFTDGTTDQVGPIATTVTEVISAEVRNAEAVTILKGQPVYLFQAQGNLATVKLAYNTSDATSAKTLGLAAENIAPNAQGLVTCQGTLPGLNTSAYNEGDTLYLGATAGTLTNVKPQAPNHLVYIGVVERANAGAGQIYVRVQNGFELDEIHDVRIISPVNGNTLIYDASTSLWKNAGITAGSGISVTNGPASITVGNTGVLSFSGGTTGLTPATATTGAVTLAGTLGIANGGTGQTTANAALNALLPAQTSQSGKYLKTDGTNASWDQLDISTADITGVLPTANGGTGLSSFTANRVLYTSSTSAIGQSANLTFDGNNLGVGSAAGSNARLFAYANDATLPTLMARQDGAGPMQVWQSTGGAEAMRFNSTGLGIGTSSPFSKLDSASARTTTLSSAAAFNTMPLTVTDTTAYAAGVGGGINFRAQLGTSTYSTYAAIWSARESGTLSDFRGSLILATADNANGYPIERMRLDSSGNLLLGTTASSGQAQLQVQFSSSNASAGVRVRNTSSSGTTTNSIFQLGNDSAELAGALYQGASTYTPGGGANALHLYNILNAPLVFGTNNTERIRIAAAGDVGIGTSAPTTKLDVAGIDGQGIQFRTASRTVGIGQISSEAAVYWGSGTALTFSTAAVERARIDTSGNLLVGTTTNTNSSRLTVNGTISETVSSVQYLVASQFDVGTAPNKIPLNQYLGNLAYQNASAIAGRVGLSAGTAALPSIGSATDAATGEWFPATSVMAWSTGGVERMRLDASGNLGVGLTNPSARVHASAADATYQLGISGTTRGIRFETNATESRIVGVDQTLISSFQPISIGGLQVVIRTNGTTEAARFNSSGNLALGNVTPSAWYTSPFIDIGQYGAIGNNSGGGGGFALYANAFEDTGGTFKYKQNYFAALYRTFAGAHQWFTAPSGTAGNAVTFTEAARITTANTQVLYQPAESAQNTSATLSVAQLQTRIITSNAAVTLTLPTGTTLEGYTSSMVVDTAFECTFIATTANAITIAANGNTTVGSLTVAGNTSGTFRFRKTATNTFTVYRVA